MLLKFFPSCNGCEPLEAPAGVLWFGYEMFPRDTNVWKLGARLVALPREVNGPLWGGALLKSLGRLWGFVAGRRLLFIFFFQTTSLGILLSCLPVWWEELGSQEPKLQLPWGPGSGHYWIHQIYSSFWKGSMVLLQTLGPQGKKNSVFSSRVSLGIWTTLQDGPMPRSSWPSQGEFFIFVTFCLFLPYLGISCLIGLLFWYPFVCVWFWGWWCGVCYFCFKERGRVCVNSQG